MRKYLKYIVAVVLVLISVYMAKANVGCSDGNYIYTEPTGSYIIENASNHIPQYNPLPRIKIQNWSGDDCGIPREIVDKYSKATFSKNPDGKCAINFSYGAGLLNYNPADSTCVDLPLDDYIWAIILAVGGFGGFIISRKGILA